MFIRFTLHSVPVVLASVILWIILGGAYIAIAPENVAGIDNIGIILSVFGVCLFFCDRVASIKLKANSWILIMKTWLWGLLFVCWGFYEWARVLSKFDLFWYFAHWAAIFSVLVTVGLWHSRHGKKTAPSIKPIEESAEQIKI